MNFSIKDFFSKCEQIRRFLRIWAHLLKKFLMENFFIQYITHQKLHFVGQQWLQFHIWFIMTFCYKMRQLFYYKMRQVVYYKMRYSYDEFRQLLQNAPILLQNATVIIKCVNFITKYDSCYKMCRFLQNAFVPAQRIFIIEYLE